ncbi:hypothetical protein AJ78_04615 [Emergomyces pasteurianus Ep9510]|uniref:Actin-like ATPase domain-containing protein n=1 Tax=Emergomyces pasteurianus Ep9510 TaxID=1447872 RepID=A0A1J9PGR3_9EURO|nr:hypothetical protein AJ78_04615 [Emergomyces pasteurianus Ep9510]
MSPVLPFGFNDTPTVPRTPRTPRRQMPKVGNKGLQGELTSPNIVKRENVGYNESCSPSPAKKKGKKDIPERRLIIGIDFGTTYSAGVAMAHSNAEPGDIEVIKEWPGNFEVRIKVPSTIADRINNSEFRQWGYEVTAGMPCSSWFKLKMAPSNTSAIQDDPLLLHSVGPSLLRVPDGETPRTLCEEYLSRLYKHVLEKIGREYTNAMVDTLRVDVVLTTPADWSRGYKIALVEAAHAAGVASRIGDSISTIDEPEAAALAAFETSRKLGNGSIFKVKTNVVVVDIGGGTICGATTIDRELHRLMESKYGNAFSSLQVKETGHGGKFMTKFESVKRRFKGHGIAYDKEYKLPLLMDVEDGTGYEGGLGEVTITREVAFQSLVDRSFGH